MKKIFELKKQRAFLVAVITALTCTAGIKAELTYDAYAENYGNEFAVSGTSRSVTAATTDTDYSDLVYEVEDDGSITVTGYTGSSSSVDIPETIDGKTVKKIGTSAFEDNQTIENIVLPDTIVEIEYKAFDSCKNLETINFPDSLKTIGNYAFTICHSLKEIDLNQVENIGECSFQLCISLEEIVVPGSIKNIPDHAFHGCSGVETLIFEEGVTSIELTAALNMYSITTIVIPESVTEIGAHALGYAYYYPNYTRIDATIYGYRYTAAENYAVENGFNFVALNEDITTTTTTTTTTATTTTTTTTTPGEITTVTLGDVDYSGTVDPVDATLVLRQYAIASMNGENTLTEEQISIGNADGSLNVDGTPLLDVVDATYILRYYSYKSMDDTFTWEKLFAM